MLFLRSQSCTQQPNQEMEQTYLILTLHSCIRVLAIPIVALFLSYSIFIVFHLIYLRLSEVDSLFSSCITILCYLTFQIQLFIKLSFLSNHQCYPFILCVYITYICLCMFKIYCLFVTLDQVYFIIIFKSIQMVKINIAGIAQSILEAGKKSGQFVYSIFSQKIPKPFWGVCGLAVAFSSLGLYFNRKWVEAAPNEWLLVIKNGKLVKCGVGLKYLPRPDETTVKFPSKVEKVYFSANNVTKQMQGIIITGFAFWSVHRNDDGPFKFYKYMQGGDSNESVKALSESVLRNFIANSTLEDVMRNRDHLRDSMLEDLKTQLTGWGIWIESVEITQVKISSQRLFNDLQAEFRQQTRLKAQFIELQGKEQLQENRQNSDLKMSEINESNETKRSQNKNTQELRRKDQQQLFESKKTEFQMEQIKRKKDINIQKLRNQNEKAIELLKNEQKITEEKQNFELEKKKEQIDFDRMHDEKTLKKYKIDATERIIATTGIKDIKINQFTGNDKSKLLGLLPSLKEN